MATYSFTVSDMSVSGEVELGTDDRLTPNPSESGTQSEVVTGQGSKDAIESDSDTETICSSNTFTRPLAESSVGTDASNLIFGSWDDTRNNQSGGNTALADSEMAFQSILAVYLGEGSVGSEPLIVTINGTNINDLGRCHTE